ncbi:MAG: hypothetical protein Q4E53_01940 [Eubacteriales bacterium]|nr:hypothetical protein [Eubacteriales bacterium]
MKEKNTEELTKVLNSTHAKDISQYLENNRESMITGEKAFSDYFRRCLKEKKIKQQDVFIQADIPERYGYKLVSMEKKTLQRDTILRLCYAGKLTLDETQKALKYYEMPMLYAKKERDAILMICFNERPGSIIEVNALLKKYGHDVLRPSGILD